MPADISGLTYFIPILSYLFVFIVIFAILEKTKIISEAKFINIFVSFLLSTIFITFSSVRVYVENVVPWFVVLAVALFFVIFLAAFSQKDVNAFMKPWLGWAFIILLVLAFLFSAFNVFSSTLNPLLPSSEPANSTSAWLNQFIYTEKFLGAILLLILTAIVSWVLSRKAKE